MKTVLWALLFILIIGWFTGYMAGVGGWVHALLLAAVIVGVVIIAREQRRLR